MTEQPRDPLILSDKSRKIAARVSWELKENVSNSKFLIPLECVVINRLFDSE